MHDPAAGPAPVDGGEGDDQRYFDLFVRTDDRATVIASSSWGRQGWDRLPSGTETRVDIDSRASHTDRIPLLTPVEQRARP